jgi:hypothetical protein
MSDIWLQGYVSLPFLLDCWARPALPYMEPPPQPIHFPTKPGTGLTFLLGPNHGNYSVTFDNAIKFSPGFSTQTLYRQLLFSYSFGTTFDTHTVVLRNEEDFWLDLDFMVLTISYVLLFQAYDAFLIGILAPQQTRPPPT